MALPDLEYSEKSNLREAFRTVLRKFTREEYTKTALNYRTFYWTSTFLPIIWKRIIQNAKLEKEYYEISYKYSSPDEARNPTREEAEILSEYSLEGRTKNKLDIEDWYIHARILMDKYSLFSHELNSLIQKKKQQTTIVDIKTRGFNDYMKSYKSEYDSLNNKKYADILIRDSHWFPELKDVRDDLITHEKGGKMWVGGVSGGLPKFGKLRLTSEHTTRLKELKSKYADSFENLNTIISYPMILRFFEENFDNLEIKDKTKVVQIRQNYGRMFPNIPDLFQKMTKLFENVNKYYIDEMEAMPDLPRRRRKIRSSRGS